MEKLNININWENLKNIMNSWCYLKQIIFKSIMTYIIYSWPSFYEMKIHCHTTCIIWKDINFIFLFHFIHFDVNFDTQQCLHIFHVWCVIGLYQGKYIEAGPSKNIKSSQFAWYSILSCMGCFRRSSTVCTREVLVNFILLQCLICDKFYEIIEEEILNKPNLFLLLIWGTVIRYLHLK